MNPTTLRSDTHEIWRYEYPGERTRYVLARLGKKPEILWNYSTADEAKAAAEVDLTRKI